MRILIVMALLLFVTGCATSSNNETMIAQIEQPTIRMECPDNGCNFSVFEYTDPNRRIAAQTNGYDVLNNAIGAFSKVALGVAPYYAISEGFKYMNSSQSTQTDNSVVDNSQRDNSRDNSQRDNSRPLMLQPEE